MLINISNLAVKYGSRYVLQNINLSLKSGEIVTIVGPNGSGKTTLFKAIIGTIPYAKGKIQIKPSLRIGYVPQQLKVDQTLPITVERFLKLAIKDNNNTEKTERVNILNSNKRGHVTMPFFMYCQKMKAPFLMY